MPDTTSTCELIQAVIPVMKSELGALDRRRSGALWVIPLVLALCLVTPAWGDWTPGTILVAHQKTDGSHIISQLDSGGSLLRQFGSLPSTDPVQQGEFRAHLALSGGFLFRSNGAFLNTISQFDDTGALVRTIIPNTSSTHKIVPIASDFTNQSIYIMDVFDCTNCIRHLDNSSTGAFSAFQVLRYTGIAGIADLYLAGQALFALTPTHPFIVPGGTSRIARINPTGNVQFFDHPELILPWLFDIGSVAVDRTNGRIYVATGNIGTSQPGKIVKLDVAGADLGSFTLDELKPSLDVDSQGNLYVGHFSRTTGEISVLSPSGTLINTLRIPGATRIIDLLIVPTTLSVTLSGTGSGTVTSSPVGISCGAICTAGFASGAQVTLTPVPGSGSVFAGWSGGGCSGFGACTVTLTANTGVTATFNLGNTPAGNVVIQPVDNTTGTTPVTLTCSNVTQPGTTSLTTSGTGTPPPSGFKLGGPPTYYELTTTAVCSGTWTVCINYSGVSYGTLSSLQIFHLEGGNWVPLPTQSLDTTSTTICASVSSLSGFAVFEPEIGVAIDIKPGSFPNAINPKAKGTIPVAILSTPSFDAPARVDRTSLTFGRKGDEPSLASCNRGGRDVNGDGRLDLVCHFKTPLTAFQAGDTVGMLKGKTKEPLAIKGSDSVRIVP